eukprot:11112114-Karenia_brevis.AAC.1
MKQWMASVKCVVTAWFHTRNLCCLGVLVDHIGLYIAQALHAAEMRLLISALAPPSHIIWGPRYLTLSCMPLSNF